MPLNNHSGPSLDAHPSWSDVPPSSPVRMFSEAVVNLLAAANGNDTLRPLPRFTLEGLLASFPSRDKKKLLSADQLGNFINELRAYSTNVRQSIPNGMRITLAAIPCEHDGSPLAPVSPRFPANFTPFYGKDIAYPDFVWGLGNVDPAPILRLFPPELLEQCYFDVKYPHPSFDIETHLSSILSDQTAFGRDAGNAEFLSQVRNMAEHHVRHGHDDFQDSSERRDFLYLMSMFIEKYLRLREILLGRLK